MARIIRYPDGATVPGRVRFIAKRQQHARLIATVRLALTQCSIPSCSAESPLAAPQILITGEGGRSLKKYLDYVPAAAPLGRSKAQVIAHLAFAVFTLPAAASKRSLTDMIRARRRLNCQMCTFISNKRLPDEEPDPSDPLVLQLHI